MRREVKRYLYDIKTAANLLEEFTDDRTFLEYEDDAMLRSAVERQCEIIGEAMAQLAKVDKETASRISHYQRIISFRNILIHEYGGVDDQLVWDVIDTYIPTLLHEVESLLKED